MRGCVPAEVSSSGARAVFVSPGRLTTSNGLLVFATLSMSAACVLSDPELGLLSSPFPKAFALTSGAGRCQTRNGGPKALSAQSAPCSP